MTYGRSRLWLGITGVGTWTLIAAFGLWRQWGAPVASGSRVVDLLALAALYALIQAPFDWLGGYWLPRKHGRATTSLAAWMKGVVAQGGCQVLAAWALGWAGERFGVWGALLVMAVVMVVLVAGQGSLARAVGGLRIVSRAPEMDLVESGDPAFVGGWVGFGAARRLWMPASWTVEWRTVQRARRAAVIQNGARGKGLALGMAFNLVGLWVSSIGAPGAGFSSLDEYLRLIFGFTLWSFAGLLILPSFSRPAVFAADRSVKQQGIAWEATARALDQRQDDEPERPKWIERIFHPVPSLAVRLRGGESWGVGAWQAARLALYLSWSVPGLLSRSVHCNAGRPDLWVLFPGD